MPQYVYGNQPETILYHRARTSSRRVNHVLMGTILEVIEDEDDWLNVVSVVRVFGTNGKLN